MIVTRREVLGSLFAAAATSAASAIGVASVGERSALAAAPTPDLELRDIRVEGTLSKRFTLLLPRYTSDSARFPLLVLLHGLGETVDERMGAYAWAERYGLISSYERLRRPPIYRTEDARVDLTDERAAQITRRLAARPFRPMAFACPYLPNVQKGPQLDEIARWIVEVVVPRARAESRQIIADDAHTTIDGCSMGGFHALETFLRRPECFAALGVVQAAITTSTAPLYADRLAAVLARVGAKPIHVQTSNDDVFRPGNVTLARELSRRGVACELLVPPGWHDQPWLREIGTMELLLWHDSIRR